MSLYAFHLGQIISTVLGQVDHDGQHGNAARTPIRGETSETDHTQKRRFRHTAIYQTIKAKSPCQVPVAKPREICTKCLEGLVNNILLGDKMAHFLYFV